MVLLLTVTLLAVSVPPTEKLPVTFTLLALNEPVVRKLVSTFVAFTVAKFAFDAVRLSASRELNDTVLKSALLLVRLVTVPLLAVKRFNVAVPVTPRLPKFALLAYRPLKLPLVPFTVVYVRVLPLNVFTVPEPKDSELPPRLSMVPEP